VRRRKPRVVVDTSVLVAGASGFKPNRGRIQSNPNAELIRRWISADSFEWLYSEDILAEYKYILAKKRVRPSTIGKTVNLLREEGIAVLVTRSYEISPDYSDNPFCDCAIEGKADYIVTNNLRDFPQEKLISKVISPNLLQLEILRDPVFDQTIEIFWGPRRKRR